MSCTRCFSFWGFGSKCAKPIIDTNQEIANVPIQKSLKEIIEKHVKKETLDKLDRKHKLHKEQERNYIKLRHKNASMKLLIDAKTATTATTV